MNGNDVLTQRFEQHRTHLRSVAYRMLGSVSEADDAVQTTWLKAAGADTSGVANLAGWLTTVVGRVCLDMLRSREARREDPLDELGAESGTRPGVDPEEEAVLADSVGTALLVVLDRLSPTERITFVLHDLFSVPFVDIAPIVDRSPATTQRIASRARTRVRGNAESGSDDRMRRYRAVEVFLAAAQNGEFEALLAMLDPDATYRTDEAARLLGAGMDLDGGRAIAEAFSGKAQPARAIMLNGEPGFVLAPHGTLMLVMIVRFAGERITGIDAVADKNRLSRMCLTLP
ncbi:sigma-70 family RNA polymerase sigma factor [Nocardia cyriacigeorgica]|uniref:sigma-70 family RNA polymerase sigma factor n=1 Tax=Nocardia cyriacigeorgica TaxID=135487 RepID=UPI0018955A34|nr:sigma-70 family RNA polymerase sigma factor [Nocardia cyriacigeorgica]MBF6082852.1 sigma-70 family RNA polymerase sigma factor [Nocardia cyriacigeorgica]MBF6326686.1 sigma-70 family RNA polymerase sigma factor [Nocardia cyriacigeorgica]